MGLQSRVGSKFPNFKISNFLLLPQNLATNQRPHSKFPHPTPRVAYQCPYAKEIRWIGPKMTELEPFSWRRSKFLKTSLSRRIAIFDVLAEILISTVRAQFWADWPQFFFCSSIITYILGWYTALPLNPDFWARKSKIPRGGKYTAPPVLNKLARRPC